MARYAYTPKQIVNKTHHRTILDSLKNQPTGINKIIGNLKKAGYTKTKCNNVVNMTYLLMDADLITKNEENIYSITKNGLRLIEAYILERNAEEIYNDLLDEELKKLEELEEGGKWGER